MRVKSELCQRSVSVISNDNSQDASAKLDLRRSCRGETTKTTITGLHSEASETCMLLQAT